MKSWRNEGLCSEYMYMLAADLVFDSGGVDEAKGFWGWQTMTKKVKIEVEAVEGPVMIYGGSG